MTYTFPNPTHLDLLALGQHVRDVGIVVFGDQLSADLEHVTFHLPDGVAPLTEEERQVLEAAVASYVFSPDPQPIREERDRRINEVAWRYERHAREVRMGISLTTDDIAALDSYIQALADIPEQPGFPGEVEWPAPLG